MSRNKFKFHVIYLWRILYSGHRIIFITLHLFLNMTRPVISVRNVFWIYYNISFIVIKKKHICAIEKGKKSKIIPYILLQQIEAFCRKISASGYKISTVRECWKEILYIPDRKFRRELYISICIQRGSEGFFFGF